MRYIFSLLLLALVSLPAAAKMYKWVDERGETHFGDTIPAQYAGQGSTEFNKKGLVIKKTDPALTPEQRKARDDELAQKKEEERAAMEQKRRDTALLNTYTTEKEIDLVRDRNLQQAELQLQGMDLRIKQIQPRYNQFRSQADALAARKKPLPPNLEQDLLETQKELKRLQEMVQQKRQEMDGLRAKFEDDKKRFRELHRIEDSAKN
ncbi:MAG: DUF4124 domain-containing protein [Sulfuricella sp.]|nr:DUF4124 domain-containing protein [Sulfuricella sp.]